MALPELFPVVFRFGQKVNRHPVARSCARALGGKAFSASSSRPPFCASKNPAQPSGSRPWARLIFSASRRARSWFVTPREAVPCGAGPARRSQPRRGPSAAGAEKPAGAYPLRARPRRKRAAKPQGFGSLVSLNFTAHDRHLGAAPRTVHRRRRTRDTIFHIVGLPARSDLRGAESRALGPPRVHQRLAAAVRLSGRTACTARAGPDTDPRSGRAGWRWGGGPPARFRIRPWPPLRCRSGGAGRGQPQQFGNPPASSSRQ